MTMRTCYLRCFRSAMGFRVKNVPGADELCPFHELLREEGNARQRPVGILVKNLLAVANFPRHVATWSRNAVIRSIKLAMAMVWLIHGAVIRSIKSAMAMVWLIHRGFITIGLTIGWWGLSAATSAGGKSVREEVSSVLHVSLISHKQFMLSRVLRAKGIESAYLALNTTDDDRLNIGYDYAIPMDTGWLRRFFLEIYLFWKVFSRYDVIHYHFTTFLSGIEGRELELLRQMGKVIVFHFRGCDVRWRTRNTQLFPDLNICQECDYPVGSCDTDFQRNKLARVREYGDLFFATTPDMLGFFEGVEHIPFIAPVGIDFEAIEPAPKREGVFRVVTSSNHPGLDGLVYIRDAVDRLKAEGHALELLEIVKKPYAEALSAYKSADVYVGKLRLGYYNNANIETMMMGVPNMSFIRDEFAYLVPDCPIISTTPETVYGNLKDWMARPDELRAVGMRGPEFVKRHHAPEAIVERMVERYNDVFHEKRAPALSSGKRS